MNKTLAITAFVFVAVVMGLSAIAPAILPEAEAHSSTVQFPDTTCEKLNERAETGNIPIAILHIIAVHCLLYD